MTAKKRPLSLDYLVTKAAHSELASIGPIIQKVMAIVSDPNASAVQLKDVIEADPPLSAKMLKNANSAFYGVKREITSIQEAIVFIGFNRVKELATSLSVAKLFSKDAQIGTYQRKQLWKHCLGVALFGKYLYRREFQEPGDDIYSAALLHDIGILVQEQFQLELFTQTTAIITEKQVSFAAAEKEVFGYDHCTLAQQLLETWHFPVSLVQAIAKHHRPRGAESDHLRAACTISLGDYLCRKQGVTAGDYLEPNAEENANACLEVLSISPESAELIIDDVISDMATLEEQGELYA